MENYEQIDFEISNYENEIERLTKKCEELAAARQKIADAELDEAVKKVIALGGYATKEPKKKPAASRLPSTAPKKYLNPENGVEWSGQGSMPDWILNGEKEKFINPAWSAHQAVKKQSKQTPAHPESDSTVGVQHLIAQPVEVFEPLAASISFAPQATQGAVQNEGVSSTQPNGGTDFQNLSTEYIPAVSTN